MRASERFHTGDSVHFGNVNNEITFEIEGLMFIQHEGNNFIWLKFRNSSKKAPNANGLNSQERSN